jgi:FlaG/FlaF family flagellin (archaellin)
MEKRGNVKLRFLLKPLLSRKAVSPWIAWVLLVAFAIMLSALMYNFMVDFTETSTEDIKKIVYNTDECRTVSISIESACFAAQDLNITLQNRNYIRIDSMDFRYYDGRVPLDINQTNITMNPNRVKTVSIATGQSSVTRVEVIPHIIKENTDIICADKKDSAEVTSC